MWIIKVLGVFLLTGATFGVSLVATEKLKNRVEALGWYVKAAEIIGARIYGTAAELYDIVNTIYGGRNYFEISRPFNIRFKPTELKKEEMRTVEEFFEGLGMGEIDSQVKWCEGYRAIFLERYNRARDEYLEKSKLYKMLGLFSGLSIAIVLI